MQLAQLSTSSSQKGEGVERLMVLVVDDHAALLDMLSWTLSFHGYRPICASNGQEALTWLRKAAQAGQYPVAILLDLLMPVMDGTKFLAALRAQWDAPVPVPPIILITVDRSNKDRLACEEVLVKPFHIRDLCEKLRLVVNADSF